MRAPRPVFVIVAPMVLVLINVGQATIPNSARGSGYFIGLLAGPAILDGLYAWWYRRRHRT